MDRLAGTRNNPTVRKYVGLMKDAAAEAVVEHVSNVGQFSLRVFAVVMSNRRLELGRVRTRQPLPNEVLELGGLRRVVSGNELAQGVNQQAVERHHRKGKMYVLRQLVRWVKIPVVDSLSEGVDDLIQIRPVDLRVPDCPREVAIRLCGLVYLVD